VKVHKVHTRKRPRNGITPRRFTVTMTEGEVDFLLGIIAVVGGNPAGARKYALRIADALTAAAGYDYQESDAYRHLRGALWLTPYGTAPGVKRAFYNHIRDAVLGYSLMGDIDIDPVLLDQMAELGDRIEAELAAEGEVIEPLPAILQEAEPVSVFAIGTQ
jgi:hypothetical protein